MSGLNVRRVLGWISIVAVVIAMAGLLGHGRVTLSSHFDQADTTVWYCAGEAINERADPYRVEPLRSCEIRNDPSRRYPWVEPAPLPGYALAAFSLMARLPFTLARTLWFYLLVGAVVTTALMLAKLARVPTLLVLLCLAMVDGYFNLFYGELPPIAVAAIVGAAVLGASGRYAAAALVGSIAMIEPHLGLPACISMFLWWPRTRLTLLMGGIVFAAASIAAIGVAGNLEYFTVLLPHHAASEIAAQDQYSLTRLLHILGCSNAVALNAGTASYLGMTVLGVALARRVARRLDRAALIAVLPPALALLGGPFVHDLQMAAALPAAIILASSERSPFALRVFALAALVFPWHAWNPTDIHGQVPLLEMGAAGAAALIATRTKRIAVRTAAAVVCVLVCAIFATGIASIPRAKVGPPTTITPTASAPTDLSSTNWAAFVSRDRSYSTPDVRDVCEKVPVWLGLLALVGMCAGMSRPRSRADEWTIIDRHPAFAAVPRMTKPVT